MPPAIPSSRFPRRSGRLVGVGLLLAAWLSPLPGLACTTGVVSGKVTADGRPLLWKNRDTSHRHNQIAFFGNGRSGNHRYLGVVNAGSKASVWMGVNEAGFCIENSVVRGLNGESKSGPGNGSFMKKALATCANVAEFESLLRKTNESGRRTNANFGVIDAQGGAAIFETGHTSYKKFDANDPEVAPHGYVVRSNFAMTGSQGKKLEHGSHIADLYSGGRFLRADALFAETARQGKLDHRFVLRHCSRDLADDEGRPFCGTINGDDEGERPESINTSNTICRGKTVSVAVFHGVRPGEDPRLTTMWTILGEPAFSVAVPCWVAAESVADPLAGKKRSSLCSSAIALRDANYDEKKRLETARMDEVWLELWALEDELFDETEETLTRWRKRMPESAEMFRVHDAAARRVDAALQGLRSNQLQPAAAAAGGK